MNKAWAAVSESPLSGLKTRWPLRGIIKSLIRPCMYIYIYVYVYMYVELLQGPERCLEGDLHAPERWLMEMPPRCLGGAEEF